MIEEAIADHETMGLVEVFGVGAQGERSRRRWWCFAVVVVAVVAFVVFAAQIPVAVDKSWWHRSALEKKSFKR